MIDFAHIEQAFRNYFHWETYFDELERHVVWPFTNYGFLLSATPLPILAG